MLEVLEPGLLTTIQDRGRPDWLHLGVPESGACDPRALAVANVLLDNDEGHAAVEMTISGPTIRALEPCVVAVAGAELGGRIVETGTPVPSGTTVALEAGQTLAFPGGTHGARAYVALPGGVDVPIVLGSRSTCLAAGFGGLDGRALRAGDILRAARPSDTIRAGRAWPGPLASTAPGSPSPSAVRIVPAVEASTPLDALLSTGWTVDTGDRMGIRLSGPPLPNGRVSILSHGVPWGAVQVPPDGAPIVLLADHQTTGGYPLLGVVATVDRPVLGQLRPGDRLRFEAVDAAAARRVLAADRARFEAQATALRRTPDWDDVWRGAGG